MNIKSETRSPKSEKVRSSKFEIRISNPPGAITDLGFWISDFT
jgi:hypothetical protein